MSLHLFAKLSMRVLLAGLLMASVRSAADEQSSEVSNSGDDNRPTVNVDGLTFGGKQFWSDEFLYANWRIQRNVLSQHYRLLDDHNMRRAWGTYEQCQAEFKRLKDELKIEPLKPRVVLVLHGLVRSRESMSNLCSYLSENSDYSVLNVSYASSREKVADHAKALARIIDRLEGVQEVNFVAHSMGNLVIRHYLDDVAKSGQDTGPHLGRFVMLAAPNNGADLALRFGQNVLFQTIWGESGKQLAEDWSQLKEHLAVPACQFGIIAGGRGNDTGFNPLVAGDDDFVVAVEETRLPGARDFLILPVAHGAIMYDRRVQQSTMQFLQHGYFTTESGRNPIEIANEGSPANE